MLNKLNDIFHDNTLIIDQKLDNICTLIKDNNITTQQHLTNGNQTNNVSHTKENINQQVLNRSWLHYQILWSQDLQECFNDLISQESPYVPAEFRFKINWNTPAYEIPLHRNAAVDTRDKTRDTIIRRKTKTIENWN